MSKEINRRVLSMVAGVGILTASLAYLHYYPQETDPATVPASPIAPNWIKTSQAISYQTRTPFPGYIEKRPGYPTSTPLEAIRAVTRPSILSPTPFIIQIDSGK